MKNKFALYAGSAIQAALKATCDDDGGNRSGRPNAIAQRYLEIVRQSLARLPLTELEMAAIVEANWDAAADDFGPEHLTWNIYDARDKLGKRGVDGHKLALRVSGLDYSDRAALCELIERVRARPELGVDAALNAAGIGREGETRAMRAIAQLNLDERLAVALSPLDEMNGTATPNGRVVSMGKTEIERIGVSGWRKLAELGLFQVEIDEQKQTISVRPTELGIASMRKVRAPGALLDGNIEGGSEFGAGSSR